MADFYFALVLSILNIAVPYLITLRDRRRLSSEELGRGWNTASWACAVFFFGLFCLPAHFWVTRRTARGLLVGGAWMIGVFVGEAALGYAVDLTPANTHEELGRRRRALDEFEISKLPGERSHRSVSSRPTPRSSSPRSR